MMLNLKYQERNIVNLHIVIRYYQLQAVNRSSLKSIKNQILVVEVQFE